VAVDVLAVVVLGPWLPDRLARRDAAARLARDALARLDLLVLALPLFAAFNLRFVVEDHGNGPGSCSERSLTAAKRLWYPPAQRDH
jgi:hypothetical protein